MNVTPFLLTKHDEELARTAPLIARILTEEEINNVSGGQPTLVYCCTTCPKMELDEIIDDWEP